MNSRRQSIEKHANERPSGGKISVDGGVYPSRRASKTPTRRASLFFESGYKERARSNSFWPSVNAVHSTKDIPLSKKQRFTRFFDNVTFPCCDRSKTRSLFIFAETNPVRMFANFVIHHVVFEYFILAVIVANCLVLALDEYLPDGDRTEQSLKLEQADSYFLIIFTTEVIFKVIAYGLILHKDSYLRNPWNILDFIIVLAGLLSKISDVFNQPGLRALRVLRPLKIVTGFESLQVVLKSIVYAMVPLLRIGFLVLFAVVIFAIIGLEFFCGVLHKSCWNLKEKRFDYTEDGLPVPCSMPTNSTNPIGIGFQCPDEYQCRDGWEGPNYGLTSFDNIYLSILTVFVILTLASWSSDMYFIDDAVGRSFNWLYFVPIIIFGSFFMLNLVLGVLSCEFANERQRVENRKEFMRLKKQKEMDFILENYIDWICKAEEVILSEDTTTSETKLKILDARRSSTFVRLKGADQTHILNEEIERQLRDKQDTSLCHNIWRKQRQLRYTTRRALKSQSFFWGVITLVFLNTALIACEHHKEPEWLNLLLTYSEYVFLSIYLFEMLLKMYGLGLRTYFSSSFNKFDFVVLMASVVEVIVQMFDVSMSFGFSSLRATRLLRIFKVTRYWQSLRNLSISLINSLKSIMSLLFLLFLFMVIFSLLGMQFFGGQMNFPSGRPKANFDTFSSSLLSVFQILTGEEWDKVMYNGMNSLGGFNFKGFLASLYFLTLVILGCYTLLNVFLAIAVDNLAKANELTSIEKAEELRRKSYCPNPGRMDEGGPSIEVVDPTNTDSHVQINGQTNLGFTGDLGSPISPSRCNPPQPTQLPSPSSPVRAASSPGLHNDQNHATGTRTDASLHINDDDGPVHILPYSSLFIFSSTNPIRKFAHFFVNLKWFAWFIITIIFCSCIELALEDPVPYESYYNFILNQIDYSFTAVFLVEIVLKVIDLGFILHKGSYCRNLWNILDLFIVVFAISSIALTASNMNLVVVKSLRALRVLRPLKTINRISKLKAVFDGLVIAVRKVMVIMSLYVLFQIIFAIIAVQLFMGRFYSCSDLSKTTEKECKGEYIEYTDYMVQVSKRIWQRFDYHFDNIGASLLTLFVVQTRSGWPDILEHAMDSSTRDHGPILEYNNNMAIFFIIYFLVFPFFFVNLFVALIVITFQEQGEKQLKQLNLDKNQKNCLEFVVNSQPLDCYMPNVKHRLRLKVWRFIICKPFDYLMSTLISLNTIALMVKFYNQPSWFDDMLNYSNIFFTSAFAVEALIKIFAYGFKNHFRQAWNVFDFITVVGSIVDIIVFYTVVGTVKTLGFLKLFRALRLMKLLKQSGSIRMLLWTFYQAIKALPYVLLLIGLLFYIYAVIGMQIFGNLLLDKESSINRHANFQNYLNALLLLFRCSTLDNWDNILVSCFTGKDCDPRSYRPDTMPPPTCGTDAAILYFVSFNFITAFMMLNLFIAVIMDNFDYLTRDSSILGPHHLDEFIQKWALYDPTASSYISYTEVYELLKELEPPVGFGKKCPWKLAYRKLIRMNMPVNEYGKVHFKTTMFALVRESLSIKVTNAEMMDQMDWELKNIMAELFLLDSKGLDLLLPPREELMGRKLTIGKTYATLLFINAWKQYKLNLNPLPEQIVKKEEEGKNPKFIVKLFKSVSDLWTRSLSRIDQKQDNEADIHSKTSKDSENSTSTREKKAENDGGGGDSDDDQDGNDDNDGAAVKRKRRAFSSLSENTIATKNYNKYMEEGLEDNRDVYPENYKIRKSLSDRPPHHHLPDPQVRGRGQGRDLSNNNNNNDTNNPNSVVKKQQKRTRKRSRSRENGSEDSIGKLSDSYRRYYSQFPIGSYQNNKSDDDDGDHGNDGDDDDDDDDDYNGHFSRQSVQDQKPSKNTKGGASINKNKAYNNYNNYNNNGYDYINDNSSNNFTSHSSHGDWTTAISKPTTKSGNTKNNFEGSATYGGNDSYIIVDSKRNVTSRSERRPRPSRRSEGRSRSTDNLERSSSSGTAGIRKNEPKRKRPRSAASSRRESERN